MSLTPGEATGRANLIVENRGGRHVILDDLVVVLERQDGGETEMYTLPNEEIDALAGSNLLAGARRVESIELPPDYEVETLSPEVSYNPTE